MNSLLKFVVKRRLVIALAAALAGCAGAPRVAGLAAEKVVIADVFERQFVGADNILTVMHECLPVARALKDPRDWQFPLPNRLVRTLSTPDYRSYLMVAGNQAVCIQETMAGYPILPVEAFERWAFFVGVPRAEQQEWFRLVAKLVAVSGTAALVVEDGKGNAHVLTYAAGLRVRGQIYLNWRSVTNGAPVPVASADTIKVTSARVTGLRTIRRPAAAGVAAGITRAAIAEAVAEPFIETLFSDTARTDYYKPAPPTRIERSVLTDAPVATKP